MSTWLGWSNIFVRIEAGGPGFSSNSNPDGQEIALLDGFFVALVRMINSDSR
jgi:hypothetical protein